MTTANELSHGVAVPPAAAFLGTPESTRIVTRTAGHRVRLLKETAAIAEQRRIVLGVTRVADVTGLDVLGIPVFNSIRPAAAEGNLTVTSGKGLNPEASRTSAVMEAIERHYGEPQGRVGVFASLTELRAERLAIDPRLLILDRGVRCTPDTPMEWLPARELTRDAIVYVPARALFVPYVTRPRLFASSSNGLASGNSLPEATMHAMLEVIERDATAFGEIVHIGWEIDLDSLPASAAGLVVAMRRAGIEVVVRRLESQFDLPTFHVTIDEPDAHDPMLINGGFGCHLDPEAAVCRALTEAAQSRLSVISGAREDLAQYRGSRLTGYPDMRSKLARWFESWPTQSFGDVADQSTDTISDDLDVLISKLAVGGCHVVLASDLAADEAELAVVRVIIPGLETAHIQRHRVGPRLAAALRGCVSVP